MLLGNIVRITNSGKISLRELITFHFLNYDFNYCEFDTFFLCIFAASCILFLGKAIFRTLLFYAYDLFFAWVFTLIEKRDGSSRKRMERLRGELENEIDMKCNMTGSDFERFVNKAAEAMLASKKLDWTFLNTCRFVFAALTTVGQKDSHLNVKYWLRSRIER